MVEITTFVVGPLQSNKTRAVAERFAWVHTIDRARIAERLSAQFRESRVEKTYWALVAGADVPGEAECVEVIAPDGSGVRATLGGTEKDSLLTPEEQAQAEDNQRNHPG